MNHFATRVYAWNRSSPAMEIVDVPRQGEQQEAKRKPGPIAIEAGKPVVAKSAMDLPCFHLPRLEGFVSRPTAAD